MILTPGPPATLERTSPVNWPSPTSPPPSPPTIMPAMFATAPGSGGSSVLHLVKLIVAAPLSSARAIEVANSSVAATAASVSLLIVCIGFVLLYLFVQARAASWSSALKCPVTWEWRNPPPNHATSFEIISEREENGTNASKIGGPDEGD